MKKIAILPWIIILFFACQKTENSTKNKTPGIDSPSPVSKKLLLDPTCGGGFSGNSSGGPNAWYTYPLNLINTDCADSGATITVHAYSLDVPNRFEIVDQNGQYIAFSGTSSDAYYIGSSCGGPGGSCYGGPWGAQIDYPNTTGQSIFTFKYDPSKTYYLKVLTIYPPLNFSPRTDYWNVEINCPYPH